MVFYQISYLLFFIINCSFHQSIIAVVQDCFAGISNLLSLGFCSLCLSLAFLCFTDKNNSFWETYYLSPFTGFILCLDEDSWVALAWKAKLGDDPLLKSYYLEKARMNINILCFLLIDRTAHLRRTPWSWLPCMPLKPVNIFEIKNDPCSFLLLFKMASSIIHLFLCSEEVIAGLWRLLVSWMPRVKLSLGLLWVWTEHALSKFFFLYFWLFVYASDNMLNCINNSL